MKIDKEKMVKVFKEQLKLRDQTLNDVQISDVIDEAQTMYDQIAPFMRKEMHPIQHIVPSFIAGVQFALDKFKRGTMDLEISTNDGGKNYKVKKYEGGDNAKN